MPSLSTAVHVRHRGIGRAGLFLGLAAAALALSGCGPTTQTAVAPEVRTSELADAGGRPCPERMPIGEDPSGHGFGVEELADQVPTLLQAQEAWVCRYVTFDVGTTPNGGAVFGGDATGGRSPSLPTSSPTCRTPSTPSPPPTAAADAPTTSARAGWSPTATTAT